MAWGCTVDHKYALLDIWIVQLCQGWASSRQWIAVLPQGDAWWECHYQRLEGRETQTSSHRWKGGWSRAWSAGLGLEVSAAEPRAELSCSMTLSKSLHLCVPWFAVCKMRVEVLPFSHPLCFSYVVRLWALGGGDWMAPTYTYCLVQRAFDFGLGFRNCHKTGNNITANEVTVCTLHHNWKLLKRVRS